MVLRFHNSRPYFQAQDQGLSCSPYAQLPGEAQENYQTYTLKDNLG